MRHLENLGVVVVLVGLIAVVAPKSSQANPSSEKVMVPGLKTSRLDNKLKGLVLLEELNCVACHGTGSSLAETSKTAPRLSHVGRRVNPY